MIGCCETCLYASEVIGLQYFCEFHGESVSADDQCNYYEPNPEIEEDLRELEELEDEEDEEI